MESTPGPPTPEELRDVERAAAAPFVDYPDLPVWWPVVGGVWFAGVAALAVLDWPSSRGLQVALIVVMIALLGAATTWYRNQRGVDPSLDPRKAPPEIGREMSFYFVGAALALAAVAATAVWLPPAATVGITFVLATGGLAVYDRRYEAAVARTRDRLS